jgi:hypothetical protein
MGDRCALGWVPVFESKKGTSVDLCGVDSVVKFQRQRFGGVVTADICIEALIVRSRRVRFIQADAGPSIGIIHRTGRGVECAYTQSPSARRRRWAELRRRRARGRRAVLGGVGGRIGGRWIGPMDTWCEFDRDRRFVQRACSGHWPPFLS